MPEAALRVHELAMRFPPNVVALASASFAVQAGEVHCLLGANGAGKSTLLKIIAGALQPSSGELYFAGARKRLRSPQDGARAGVAMIYQELDLVPQLSVAENIFLGRSPQRFSFIKQQERNVLTQRALERVGANFDPQDRVESLSIANQQLTAIARSLTADAKIIIMDEPSATLNELEQERIFAVIRDLAAQGVAIIYVSHRLEEIRAIGDRVTVLRGGRSIASYQVSEVATDDLVKAVIGDNRSLVQRRSTRQLDAGRAKVLEVENITVPGLLELRDLCVHQGDIVGITGLNGSGRTSFLRALFGDLAFSGKVLLHGHKYQPANPRAAIKAGVGLAPENRKTQGLVLDMSLSHNASLAYLRRHRLLPRQLMHSISEPALTRLQTKYADLQQSARQLSGGNQQKIVLAKWIIEQSNLLLLDEPSRGLDVGAKADLYKLINTLANDGVAVIIASNELDELYAACDFIWVFHEGRNIAQFDPDATRQELILEAALLGSPS